MPRKKGSRFLAEQEGCSFMNDLNILYEDNHIIVVMKPQGVPSCGDESGDDSLLEAVRRYVKVTYN